ncbi:beta-lactamase-like protein [Gongronella butleri]|nr:beta-lactamase-like protein [Gongronella butleri]
MLRALSCRLSLPRFSSPRFYSTMFANITPQQLHTELTQAPPLAFSKEAVQLVDVRNHNEIEEHGRIQGALNIPYHVAEEQPALFQTVLRDLDRSKKLIFHCASGRRSAKAAQIATDLGYDKVFNVEGGFTQWKQDNLPVEAFKNNHSPWVHPILERETETAQYIVADLDSREAYIMDAVLDYDPLGGVVHPKTANAILDFVKEHDLRVTKIIDTHVHADHLTAAMYLKSQLETKPKFYIGKDVTKVQDTFAKKYNLSPEEMHLNDNQFDELVSESSTWTLGKDIQCSIIATPGHTPACLSYRIGDAAFVGDTLFMPDIGTARCDFPGGSASDLYNSIHKMYNTWPDDTRVYVGHDYPPSGRSYDYMVSLGTHKKVNKMIDESKSLEEYTALRQARDSQLRAPRFIHPSLQTNLRGGVLPPREKSVYGEGDAASSYFKIPVRWVE